MKLAEYVAVIVPTYCISGNPELGLRKYGNMFRNNNTPKGLLGKVEDATHATQMKLDEAHWTLAFVRYSTIEWHDHDF